MEQRSVDKEVGEVAFQRAWTSPPDLQAVQSVAAVFMDSSRKRVGSERELFSICSSFLFVYNKCGKDSAETRE